MSNVGPFNLVDLVSTFFANYGWWCVGLLVLIKIIGPNLLKKFSPYFKENIRNDTIDNRISQDKNREKLQVRYNKMSSIVSHTPKINKLTKKDMNLKNSSAYRFATSGNWSKYDNDKYNNNNNNNNNNYYNTYLNDKQSKNYKNTNNNSFNFRGGGG